MNSAEMLQPVYQPSPEVGSVPMADQLTGFDLPLSTEITISQPSNPNKMGFFRKTLIAGGGALATLGVACGSDGEGDRAVVVLGTADAAPAVQTVVEVPASTSTPTPEKTPTPTIQGPTEAQKVETRAQALEKLREISTEITALTSPSNPDISPEVFKLQQAEISDIVKQVNALLEKGDVINAQIQLADLQNKIQHVGNLYKGTFVQKAEKDKHDPEGKYLPKNLSIDPAVLPWYWTVTGIRVAFGDSPAAVK